MRRLTGLLTSLLLLHLTLVGADLTCAKHGVGGAAHASQPETPSHAGDHAAAPGQSGHDGDSCEVPTLPACCAALAACGVSVAAGAAASTGDPLYAGARVLAAADDAPASWTLEPDPPPPKA